MTDDLFPAPPAGEPIRVRVIDYETTGMPEDEGAEVIELGRIDYNLVTATIENPFTSLARPMRPIPPVTMAVHHITEAMVAGAPHIGQVWGPFWDGLAPTDICAAHNAKFEQHFHRGNGRRWICTCKCARVVWPDAPGFGNQVLRYWLGIDGSASMSFDPARADPPHRALPDAYVTAHILACLLWEKTLDELVEISRWPALHTRWSFGKHKGKRLIETPADYLEWVRDRSDMDEDLKFSARYWLKKLGV